MEIIDILKKIDVNLLIFLLTALVGFISWLVKGIIEAPLSSAKNTFDKHFNTRIEILTEIKNRLALILYLTNGDNNDDIDKFKSEIQEILLKDGKSAYISKDILDYALNISVLPETDINKIHLTIKLIDKELNSSISKVNEELQFYHKFSNHNPIKRILGLTFITTQYLLVIGLVLAFIYTIGYFLLKDGIISKVTAALLVVASVILINLWLSNRSFNFKKLITCKKKKVLLSKEDNLFLQKSSFLLRKKLRSDNQIEQFEGKDFSSMWYETKSDEVFGIIGESHQRLKIKITHIEQNKENPREYFVFGESEIRKNIVPFNGIITITNIHEYVSLYFGIDDKHKDSGIKNQGILISVYQFNQNHEGLDFGIFQGKLYSKWYIDKYNNVKYDDIGDFSDGYFNNAYIGTFKSIKEPFSEKCNWGDFRVPLANEDFDIGSGDFKVSDKYLDNGWRD